MEKKQVVSLIDNHLSIIGASELIPTDKAGQYRFNLNGINYLLNHRHRNMCKDLCHLTPKEFEAINFGVTENEIPCVCWTILDENKDIERLELLICIISTNQIENELGNCYNKSIIKPNDNIIFKYNNDITRNMLCSSCDICCSRFFFPENYNG